MKYKFVYKKKIDEQMTHFAKMLKTKISNSILPGQCPHPWLVPRTTHVIATKPISVLLPSYGGETAVYIYLVKNTTMCNKRKVC